MLNPGFQRTCKRSQVSLQFTDILRSHTKIWMNHLFLQSEWTTKCSGQLSSTSEGTTAEPRGAGTRSAGEKDILLPSSLLWLAENEQWQASWCQSFSPTRLRIHCSSLTGWLGKQIHTTLASETNILCAFHKFNNFGFLARFASQGVECQNLL